MILINEAGPCNPRALDQDKAVSMTREAVPRSTLTGVRLSAAPSPVDPQQTTSPPRSSAHVWNPPAEMIEADSEAAAER
jgi:hypothetical protein